MASILLSTVFALTLATASTGLALPGGPPRAALCDKSSGEVQRKALVADPELTLHGCVPGVRIIAFSFTCTGAKGETITWRTREAKLTEQMLKTIGTLRDGATFTLTEFDVVDGKGTAHTLPDAVFTLKD